jgi:hypothetical protein
VTVETTIQPAPAAWADRARTPVDGALLGRPLAAWRGGVRRELGLADDVPVIATGHQTLLWHPGILAKYVAMDAVAAAGGFARANLVVDQHALTDGARGDFGGFDVPIRRRDGALGVHRITLTRPRPDVPMAHHEAFEPAAPVLPADTLPSVVAGVERIHHAIATHQDAPTAARQMAAALDELMRPWLDPAPTVTATELLASSLGRAVLEAMVEDPWRCAAAYNAAVTAVPEARVAPLLVRDDYVELPLWRIRDDGRRMHAYDNDIEAALAGGDGAPTLMPRALCLTALIRLGLCDLFVHGLGGALYDRAMEQWVEGWLSVTPGAIAVASADLRLPLGDDGPAPDVARATAAARHAWHDPEPPPRDGRTGGPGPVKRELLEAIASAPYRSARRREAFFAMHRELATLRSMHVGHVERLQRAAVDARRRVDDAAVTLRRDWPFPLYEPSAIEAMAETIRSRMSAGIEAAGQG